jgi:hypothetical protein
MKKYAIIMKRIVLYGLLCLFISLPLSSSAWGMLGHRIVGQIAQSYLSGKARKGVASVLGSESLAMAANWADFIKSDTAYKHIDSWHYINLPAGLEQQDVFDFLADSKEANVYNKVLEMIVVLKEKQSTAEEKRMAMRLLIHFVGDLNQPMHTARKEDLGGNKVYVTWFGDRSNLHRIWDSDLIDYQQLSYTEYAEAVNHPVKDQLAIWRRASLQDFVYGSYQACNIIYAKTALNDKLGYRYNYDFVDLLNVQLLKGGICLASILNEIYR